MTADEQTLALHAEYMKCEGATIESVALDASFAPSTLTRRFRRLGLPVKPANRAKPQVNVANPKQKPTAARLHAAAGYQRARRRGRY